MKKIPKRKGVLARKQAGPDLAGLMSEMQRRLVSLEEKIDTLISRPAGESFERHAPGRHFPKQVRPFERHSGFGKGRQEDGFRERSLTQVICAECGTECEVPFKPSADRPVYCRECFAKRKEGGSFRDKHGGNFSGKNRKFHHKKKFSFRRKK